MDEKKPLLVMKFGGTSVGGAEAFAQARQIVENARREWGGVVVVLSAMSGVTNLLLESAEQAVLGKTEFIHQAAGRLRAQHEAVADALLSGQAQQAQLAQARQEIRRLIADFTNLCEAMAVLGESTPRALDAVAALGERLSVRLFAAGLEAGGIPAQFVEATQLIVTDRKFQAGQPDIAATRPRVQQVLLPLIEAGKTPVVTGFIAATPEGTTITLGRGGSDYSAAILGAALPAADVWIWTDVDGVMTADPRLTQQARTIPELTYLEIAELAYFGAKVVHPKTIRPVIEAGIGLRVCNTFNPDHPGTRIVPDSAEAKGRRTVIKAVTAIRGQSLVTVEGRGMLGVPGVAARTFGAVASTGTSVALITQASSEQSICFAAPQEAITRVAAALEAAFENELARGDIDRIWASQEATIITVVGAGMRNTPGIAGRIFSALGARRVNVIAIAQGSSEVAISLVVDAADAEEGVRTLHDLIIE
ncbi:MAG: aspartate kinase [Chloroflexi bacterium]|nr:aspartate kinase [Chloroflexota bacterium]